MRDFFSSVLKHVEMINKVLSLFLLIRFDMENNKILEPKFKTLVILDLETTGLVYDEPKITELAMIAVHM